MIFWFTVDCARPSAFAISPCVNPNSLILSLIFFELIGVFLTSLPYLCCKIDKLLHIAKNGNIWYNVFVFVILPSLAPAAFKTKGGENMVLTKGEALEEALEIVKVMLSDSACTSIYPNAESAKDVAEFVRTLTDELVAIE